MSKILVGLAFAASAIIMPTLSFAQTNGPVTHTQVNAAQNEHKLATDAVGGVASNGGTSSGARMGKPMPSSCVGPVSFCDVYFGS
jgi:hypothetical protein